MHRFIISTGQIGGARIVGAPSIKIAHMIAVSCCAAEGIGSEDAWAAPYSDELAYQFALIDEPTRNEIWRSEAPWR